MHILLNFVLQIDVDEFGSVRTVDLKDNGADIPVTNENRKGALMLGIVNLTFLYMS